MEILAGTSGFSFEPWRGPFYPADLAKSDMLRFYAGQLPAVEINNTFYRLPREEMLESWAAQVPEGFRFSIKASRKITHFKRLSGTEEETEYLLRTLGALGRRLGVVLFQLPPNLPRDLPRLEAFLELLGAAPVAFELRHPSWHDEELRDLLRRHGAALCLADTDEAPLGELHRTADHGYLRLRRSEYGDDELAAWVAKVRDAGWDRAFVFFKHEDEARGPRLARRFLELAGA